MEVSSIAPDDKRDARRYYYARVYFIVFELPNPHYYLYIKYLMTLEIFHLVKGGS